MFWFSRAPGASDCGCGAGHELAMSYPVALLMLVRYVSHSRLGTERAALTPVESVDVEYFAIAPDAPLPIVFAPARENTISGSGSGP